MSYKKGLRNLPISSPDKRSLEISTNIETTTHPQNTPSEKTGMGEKQPEN